MLYAAPAGAFALRSGSIEFDNLAYASGEVHLEGGQQFRFDGWALNPRVNAVDCVFGCNPQETVSLSMEVVGIDLPGIASLRGESYTDVGSPLFYNSLSIQVFGRAKAPRFRRSTEKTTTEIATMVVTFYHYETVPLAPVVETFLGRVAVSMLWHWGEYFPSGPQWDLRHIAYDVIGK